VCAQNQTQSDKINEEKKSHPITSDSMRQSGEALLSPAGRVTKRQKKKKKKKKKMGEGKNYAPLPLLDVFLLRFLSQRSEQRRNA
jgi:hypothetical protein